MEEKSPIAQDIRVAVVQWEVVFGRPDLNRMLAKPFLQFAAEKGADIAVLPELCNSGYMFQNPEEVSAFAEPLDGPTVSFWRECAKELDLIVVGGLAESKDGLFYNSLVAVGPEGILGCYRKIHLFDQEKKYFEAGEEWVVLPVCGTKLGLMICYDSWFPESARILTMMGAEVIAMAGCVRHEPGWTGPLPPVATLQLAQAHSNSVFIASALRTGEERGAVFSGGSFVCGPKGPIAGYALPDASSVNVTKINLVEARFKRKTKRVHPILDRRPETYGLLAQQDDKANPK